MNFKTYITEAYGSNTGVVTPRTKLITEETARNLVATDYSEAFNFLKTHEPCFFRGLYTKINYGYIDPSIRYKPSKETYNFYQFILDELPAWKTFPRRGKALIGSTTTGVDYGINHVVIPKNGAKIAIASDHDIWECFNVGNLDVWSTILYRILKRFSKEKRILDDGDQERFKAATLEADEYYKIHGREKFFHAIKNSMINKLNDSYIQILQRTFSDYDGDMWKYFAKIFDPISNGFKLVTSYSKLSDITDELEIWTDSPCLIIDSLTFNKFKKS